MAGYKPAKRRPGLQIPDERSLSFGTKTVSRSISLVQTPPLRTMAAVVGIAERPAVSERGVCRDNPQ